MSCFVISVTSIESSTYIETDGRNLKVPGGTYFPLCHLARFRADRFEHHENMGGPLDPAREPNEPITEIVVMGLRQSIETSEEIKQDAKVIVDSISAVDNRALPGRSVTGAAPRIPSVEPSAPSSILRTRSCRRTDSIQFGRPFRRNAADVGATGVPCEDRIIGGGNRC
jgi:hypothetical protein